MFTKVAGRTSQYNKVDVMAWPGFCSTYGHGMLNMEDIPTIAFLKLREAASCIVAPIMLLFQFFLYLLNGKHPRNSPLAHSTVMGMNSGSIPMCYCILVAFYFMRSIILTSIEYAFFSVKIVILTGIAAPLFSVKSLIIAVFLPKLLWVEYPSSSRGQAVVFSIFRVSHMVTAVVFAHHLWMLRAKFFGSLVLYLSMRSIVPSLISSYHLSMFGSVDASVRPDSIRILGVRALANLTYALFVVGVVFDALLARCTKTMACALICKEKFEGSRPVIAAFIAMTQWYNIVHGTTSNVVSSRSRNVSSIRESNIIASIIPQSHFAAYIKGVS